MRLFFAHRCRIAGLVVGLVAAPGTHPGAALAQPAEVAPPPRSLPLPGWAAPSCGETTIALALRDLFPPAPAELRVHSAAQLAACRVRGAEGALAAALPLSTDDETGVAIAGALAQFHTVVAHEALRATAQRGAAPRVRAVAMQALAQAGVTDDLVAVINDPGQADESRATALDSLAAAGRIPSAPYLAWVTEHAGPNTRAVAERLLTESARPDLTHAPASAAPPSQRAATSQPADASRAPLAPSPPPAAPLAPPGPIDGRPLTIAASTVAGAALFLNLSRLGIQDATPQLLLGTAGAVIGFGTSWALSRLGVRPTVEQAAWFANTTAWGTLAGVTLYSGANLDNYKLRYGALIAGEMVGMAAGVWSGRQWRWTASQVALSDSLLLGVALTAVGEQRLRGDAPGISPAMAIGVVPAMIAAAIAGHALSPTRNDLILMTDLGVSGAWLGSLVASGAAGTAWLGSYQGQGGLIAGAGIGFLAGSAASAFSDVDPARVRMGAYAMLAGNALGLGAHMALTGLDRGASGLAPGDSERWKLGAGMGGAALGALGFAIQPRLHLGSRTVAMQLWGVSYAAGVYGLASWASTEGKPITDANTATLRGGMLAFGVTGGVTGLWLSQRHEPDPRDQWTTFGITAASLAAGWGGARLLTDTSGDAEGIGIAAGAAVGLTAGALFTHSRRLTPPAFGSATLGMAYGGLMGALLPSSSKLRWQDNRATGGGALLGLGAGALVGATLAQATGASGRDVAATSAAAVLGLGVGVGAVSMLRDTDTDTRAPRIGAMAGATAFAGGAMLLGHALRLDEPRPPGAAALAVTTTVLGLGDGLWLGALLDPTGTPSGARADRLRGGLLFGGALGLSTGMVLAPYLHPDTPQLLVLTAATAIGTGMGRGVALLASDTAGRADSIATLAGALAGTVGGAVAAAQLPDFDATDVGASSLGAGTGALLGALGPSLFERQWSGLRRDSTGALWLGMGAGAFLGDATRRGSGASAREVGLASLAALDGLATGIGFGLMLRTRPQTGDSAGDSAGDDDRPIRLGMAAGTVAGLGLGMATWSRQTMGPGDSELVMASMALAAWNGALIPRLGHGSSDDVDGQRVAGGLLGAAGTASFVAAALTPHLTIDPDLVENALMMDAVFSGFGLGIGELVSARADAPVWGMLGAGAVGLGLGGALHGRIEIGQAAIPLLTFGTGLGLWTGAWVPYLLQREDQVDDRQRGAGVLAGLFGGLGISMLAGAAIEPSSGTIVAAGLGSAIGASVAGGVALVSEQIHDQLAAGLTLGASALGAGAGGLLASRLRFDGSGASHATVGGILGTAEALTFAWSARASERDPLLGAGFIGAGVGTSLGLATAATMNDGHTQTPVLAGFAAWGGWMGAFSGSLVARDPHEITAGALLGSNVGFLAGYGLIETELVEPADFGWLSLGAALGTAVGAGVGAPFASRGEPRPILGGLAIGSVVGMTVGAIVISRFEHAAKVADASVPLRSRTDARRQASPHAFPATSEGPTAGEASSFARSSSTATSSTRIAAELDRNGATRRKILRAIDASIRIEDCAPLIGALPSSRDAPPTTGTPPILIGLTGRWH